MRGDEPLRHVAFGSRLPHQPCRVFLHRKDDCRVGWDGFPRLENMQAHGVVGWLVQDQGDEIEAHDLPEPPR